VRTEGRLKQGQIKGIGNEKKGMELKKVKMWQFVGNVQLRLRKIIK
jgi:hypothetical protein